MPGLGTTPFLILNPGVIERGDRLLGSVHAAYFYKSLSLIGEWQYGYGNYASLAHPSSVQVPFTGFYVVGGYFLTGEQVERRSRVNPLRPLVPTRKGETDRSGAWEVVARVSELSLGEKIFSRRIRRSRISGPTRRSRPSSALTGTGMNTLNCICSGCMANFADPVQYRPGGLQKTADMFWLRFQLYF